MKTSDGLWRLSPSGLYGYTECSSCFWLDNHHGKAPMRPLTLNSAIDAVLKARYDKYRGAGMFPPEAAALAQQGNRVFTDLDRLNEWRNSAEALQVRHPGAGYLLRGKIDDVFLDEDDRLVPADYKASGNAPAQERQKYYRDQLAAYGFMFRRHGHPVSDRAYLLHYYVKDKSDPALEVKLEGRVERVDIGSVDIEGKLAAMVALLNGPYPGHNPGCGVCSYHQGRSECLA